MLAWGQPPSAVQRSKVSQLLVSFWVALRFSAAIHRHISMSGFSR